MKRGRGRPTIETLTESQRRVLDSIELRIDRDGHSPTMRELADDLELSVATVYKLVQRLERNGFVSRTEGKSRSLTVRRSASEQRLVGLVSIPLLGIVPAGTPLMAPENQLGELLVDSDTVRSGKHFALTVTGQSMIDAGIHSGDIVVVRQQPLAEHRDIVVALLNDETTVKRLFYRDGQVTLLPENVRYKPIPISTDDDFRILGKVVAVRSNIQKKSRE